MTLTTAMQSVKYSDFAVQMSISSAAPPCCAIQRTTKREQFRSVLALAVLREALDNPIRHIDCNLIFFGGSGP